MSSTAAAGPASPGNVTHSAASMPTGIISQVTAFAESGVDRKMRVAYGDSRRMYSRPVQCSALARLVTERGCVTARSSAIEGRDEVIHSSLDLVRVHLQVLEDGVAVRPRGRRVPDRGRELLGREAEVARQPGHAVAAQARVEVLGERPTAQVRREQHAHRDLLAVQAV